MAELNFMIWLHEHLSPTSLLTQIMKLISEIGDHGIVWIALGLAMLCFKRTRVPGAVMLTCLAIGWVLNDFVLKDIFARPRPVSDSAFLLDWATTSGYKIPKGFSFPSGHAMGAATCCFALIYFYRWRAALPTLTGALIVISRVYISAHYPTDVLTGIALGLIIARLVTWAYAHYFPRFKHYLTLLRLSKRHNALLLINPKVKI